MTQTLLWYDIETFGKYPMWDRIAQFAAVRTNDQFEPLEDPIVLYCKPSPEYIPDPQSCLITGITPQEAEEKGVPEYEFIHRINEIMSQPGTCVAGYNNIRFDDEFIRNALYRNFFDPYRREWANSNSRWDLIDLVRVTHDLRPDGITWVRNDEGKPSFRLDELTAANNLNHRKAHDALSDFWATIDLARLIQEKQPKLFSYVFGLRRKEALSKYLDIHEKRAILHTSGMFTSEKGCTSIVAPIAVDPVNRNCVYAFDLRSDPTPLLELSVEEIRRRVFTSGEERILLKGIHVNKCPVVAPLETMDPVIALKLGLDVKEALRRREILLTDPHLTQKIFKVFKQEHPRGSDDPDLRIYSGGFFRDEDKARFETIHTTSPEKWSSLSLSFEDHRLPEMLWRMTCRNYPEYLSPQEKKRWKSFCVGRLLSPPYDKASGMGEFEKRLENYRQSKEPGSREKLIIKQLSDYADKLKKEVLDY